MKPLNAALFGGLMWLYRRKRFDGQIFATYLICYALLRAFVELFRGDYPKYYLAAA
ncbi:MAG: prolipoprotein diacylglyceryl transferase family protein [Verrucomicrobiota bacterium]